MSDSRSEPNIYVSEARDGYWLASIPIILGCNASGASRDEAVANARRAFRAYLELLDAQGVSVEHWKGLDPDRFAVVDPEGPLFPEDQLPVEEHDLRDFLHVFEAQHAALIALAATLTPDELERAPDADTWSVRQALEHMVATQATLLGRLERWPADPFNTLQAVHRLVGQRFSVMEPDDTKGVKVISGRPWTVRRVMRRLLEHEWEHYGHVREIISALGQSRRP
ncbi:MAG TPA: type II toxin-antitoxin system HicB family antitoxin [Candidatus Limnocylindrales bacterium]|nr:type II toxin-antitoxin system HicB family antitoxin [Candidatus Limnocylindrales bacterium]